MYESQHLSVLKES